MLVMYIKEFQNILDDLCEKESLEPISVIFDKNMLSPKNNIGEYNHIKQIIIINNEQEKNIDKILYHEFRHYWQFKKYTNLYMWWMYRWQKVYDKYYYTDFCSLEADARIFGDTLGKQNKEYLLKMFSIEDFIGISMGSVQFNKLLLKVGVNLII